LHPDFRFIFLEGSRHPRAAGIHKDGAPALKNYPIKSKAGSPLREDDDSHFKKSYALEALFSPGIYICNSFFKTKKEPAQRADSKAVGNNL